MTAPESALDVAREVCPGLRWSRWSDDGAVGDYSGPAIYFRFVVYCNRWEAWTAAPIASKHGPDPRACLRAVLAEVHRWALDVARATVPAGYQLVTACVPPEIPGEDPDPIV